MSCAALLLAGCLEEGKDPSATSDAGKLTGTYYATGLGDIAVRIQDIVVTDPTWFTATASNGEILDLADRGIVTPSSLGGNIRAAVCRTGVGDQVMQMTWLDASDADGKFYVRGLDQDAGAVSAALRQIMPGNQVGTYTEELGGITVSMNDGSTLTMPSGCNISFIPRGAPMVVFTIDSPAKPTETLTRTEYHTVACGMGSVNGVAKQQRGTQVEKRTVSYNPDGTYTATDWNADDAMGTCITDIDVELKAVTSAVNTGVADPLAAFAGLALHSMLQAQLSQDCAKTGVDSEGVNNQVKIDSCSTNTQITRQTSVTDTGTGTTVDQRTMRCAGPLAGLTSNILNLGNQDGTTQWTSGTATLNRVVANNTVSSTTINQGQRDQWVGVDISCAGKQDFFVTCGEIPGAPTDLPQASAGMTRYDTSSMNTYGVSSYGITLLDMNYFTGRWQSQNIGVDLRNNIVATSWENATKLKPAVTSANWAITKNKCVWSERVNPDDPRVACPNYAGQPGSWTITSGHSIGYRPYPKMHYPTQTVDNRVAQMFTMYQQRTPKEHPMTGWAYCSGCNNNFGYAYSYPFGSNNPTVLKVWGIGSNVWTTLLNHDGVSLGYRPVLEGNKLVVKQQGFGEQMVCGRDANEVVTYIHVTELTGPDTGTATSEYDIPVTEYSYREWKGTSYETGAWSYPDAYYTSTAGTWNTLAEVPTSVTINNRWPDTMDGCTAKYGFQVWTNGDSSWTTPAAICCQHFYGNNDCSVPDTTTPSTGGL
jgi:hypothetical protein